MDILLSVGATVVLHASIGIKTKAKAIQAKNHNNNN